MIGFKDFIAGTNEEVTQEALTFAGRRKKAIAMKRNKQKLQRQKKVVMKRAATIDRLKKRSDRTARSATISRVSGGQNKANMSVAAKARAEKRASAKPMATRTKNMSRRLIHKKRALDTRRR